MAGRIGHLGELGRELVPHAPSRVAQLLERRAGLITDLGRLAHGRGLGEHLEVAGLLGASHVLGRDALPVGHHHAAILIVHVHAGLAADERLLGVLAGDAGPGILGRLAGFVLEVRSGLSRLVLGIRQRALEPTDLGLECIRNLRIDEHHVWPGALDVRDGQVGGALGQVAQRAVGNLQADDLAVGLVEVHVPDGAQLLALISEDLLAQQRLLAVEDGVDAGVARRGHDRTRVGDDDGILTEGVHSLDGYHGRATQQPTFIDEKCDHGIVVLADDQILDAVDADAISQGQDVLADDGLAFAHGGLLGYWMK